MYIIVGNFLTKVDIVDDKVGTEKIIDSLMDENFPSLTLTDQFSYKLSGEWQNQQGCKKFLDFDDSIYDFDWVFIEVQVLNCIVEMLLICPIHIAYFDHSLTKPT